MTHMSQEGVFLALIVPVVVASWIYDFGLRIRRDLWQIVGWAALGTGLDALPR